MAMHSDAAGPTRRPGATSLPTVIVCGFGRCKFHQRGHCLDGHVQARGISLVSALVLEAKRRLYRKGESSPWSRLRAYPR